MISTIRRDLDSVLLFARLAQLGTFTAAAKSLGLPKATLSTRISDLEKSLGHKLLERSTRRTRLTDAGRVYLVSCERILDELEGARHAVDALASGPRGLLRVSAPIALSRSVLAPLMPEFISRHPELRTKLDVNNRALDQLGEENELALIIGAPPPHPGAVLPITRFRTRLVASMAYLRKHGRPKTPSDLAAHELLGGGDRNGRLEWQLRRGDEVVDVGSYPRLTLIDPDTRATLVKENLGISWLPAFLCQKEIDQGSLAVVLRDWDVQWVRLQALLPSAQMSNTKAMAMVEFLRERLGPEQ